MGTRAKLGNEVSLLVQALYLPRMWGTPRPRGEGKEASGGFLEGMGGEFLLRRQSIKATLLRGTALPERKFTSMGYTNRIPGNKVLPTSGGALNCAPRAHLGRPVSTVAILRHRDWQGKRHSPRGLPLMCAALSRTCPDGLIINQDFLLSGVKGRDLNRLRQSRG